MDGYIALVLRQPGGGYRAVFPDVEGCRAEGKSVDEALANARSEIKAHAARLARNGQTLPSPRPASDVTALSAKHGAVAGAGMIAVAMSDHRAVDGQMRIDVELARLAIEPAPGRIEPALGMGF